MSRKPEACMSPVKPGDSCGLVMPGLSALPGIPKSPASTGADNKMVKKVIANSFFILIPPNRFLRKDNVRRYKLRITPKGLAITKSCSLVGDDAVALMGRKVLRYKATHTRYLADSRPARNHPGQCGEAHKRTGNCP